MSQNLGLRFFWKDSVQECYLLKVRVAQRDAARTGAGGAQVIAQAENCLGLEMILQGDPPGGLQHTHSRHPQREASIYMIEGLLRARRAQQTAPSK